VGESELNLTLMELIDKLFLDDPTLGVKGMRDELRDLGYEYNDKRIRRLMRKMALMPIYSKQNLSRLGLAKYIHPYLLRHLNITRPNQVWAIDITYIPMRHGFMYLTAIIDVYSRFVVGWQLSNTLDKENQTAVLHEAIRKHGVPEIINSDQGSQYTCEHWVSTVKSYGIQISMDGRDEPQTMPSLSDSGERSSANTFTSILQKMGLNSTKELLTSSSSTTIDTIRESNGKSPLTSTPKQHDH
jgi:putative transposase